MLTPVRQMPPGTPIVRLTEGSETAAFKKYFALWPTSQGGASKGGSAPAIQEEGNIVLGTGRGPRGQGSMASVAKEWVLSPEGKFRRADVAEELVDGYVPVEDSSVADDEAHEVHHLIAAIKLKPKPADWAPAWVPETKGGEEVTLKKSSSRAKASGGANEKPAARKKAKK